MQYQYRRILLFLGEAKESGLIHESWRRNRSEACIRKDYFLRLNERNNRGERNMAVGVTMPNLPGLCGGGLKLLTGAISIPRIHSEEIESSNLQPAMPC